MEFVFKVWLLNLATLALQFSYTSTAI